MKAFISYSHKDENYLERLHVHLAQLKREELIEAWTDEAIPAGGKLDNIISESLEKSDVFIALLSPDYINSNYCYDKEFKRALKMQEDNQLTIIPIILEPCDWTNTPFKQFKALPKDGKPISDWNNMNTAFLNIIQEVRLLLQLGTISETLNPTIPLQNVKSNLRNYKIKKDFDSIEKMEFVENGFDELKKNLKNYIDEVVNLDNIKARVLKDNNISFECLIVNRNKVNTEATLELSKSDGKNTYHFNYLNRSEFALNFKINLINGNNTEGYFNLEHDEFNMYWTDNTFGNYQQEKKLSIKEMADYIWKQWLGCVGIEF
ncbi:toll/interleukin-1 receptor domain-containing protein [Subsaxibacter sp. CAU 1640]|uniref:toll/interleukin-1 receptor domain-containing protein n=1 Tax=Subsaxibacter sp. CAU 1640 TaxID=2933271 RepID=UPI002005CEAD|nr:toll/interleukin-1 receptor domain-containing protein [Subsaxibacter sp. CAU 1640]MCK7590604.1 toll/interleukin-1 receptor domain-containing protein [Subsaxibacter sp. CAU 1640]